MKLGFYGGSFDPPHVGHAAATQCFAHAMRLDKLLIIPAAQSPLKGNPSVAAEHRLELCRHTFDYPVSDLELQRIGVNYTIDTVLKLREQHPAAELFMLIGTDQLANFTRWHRWQEILQLCTVCALQRDAVALQTQLPVHLISGFVPVDISSTKLRGMLALGEDVSTHLTPAALDYIQQHKLYTEPNLPPKRLQHSRNVADTAEQLAIKHGADVAKAKFAGLWHDCGKYMVEHGWMHGAVGADYLQQHMGIDDEDILDAVRYHTLGRENMSTLEQIIVAADLTSTDRDYPDVEHVRALAQQDLAACCRYIMEYKARTFLQRKAASPQSLREPSSDRPEVGQLLPKEGAKD
ncbi:MAG: nicotinate (nicotinamide) nucleotide adenylyltransferase [Oscillospiraceae bacterium]|nr:nicotinate (nicotinamide) nucleotide adenylyltransferase [Oscillospiraceae bacterium]